jgi:two-component system invasion response regulator UvrY
MNENGFNEQIATLQQRMVDLQAQVAAAPARAGEVVLEALEDLGTVLEELHVADEELREQNEELALARLEVEMARQWYQELFDLAPDGYLVTDTAGVIQEANQAAAAMLDLSPQHLVGKPFILFVASEAHRAFRTQLNRLQQFEGIQEWQIDIQTRQGPSFPAALTVAAVRDVQGALVGWRWLLHDITLRRQAETAMKQAQESLEQRVAKRTVELQRSNARLKAEIVERQRTAEHAQQAEQALRTSQEQLRQLTVYLQNAQEQERSQIARQLHDDLAQTLTSLKMDVVWLSRRAEATPTAWRERLTAMAAALDTLGESMRRIGTELRPNVLDDLGLMAAIEWQLKDVSSRTNLTYSLKTPTEELTIDAARSTAMFRIFQEALTNVVRHAEATSLAVRLLQYPDAWLLEVADNGKGITPEQLTDYTSLGLLGMRERAHLWGGDVIIQGRPGVGTTVTIRIPHEPLSTRGAAGVIRVLIGDDHATVRAGVKRFLADSADLVVAGEASNAQEILDAVETRMCDVVLLDVSLPGRDGLDVLLQLKQLHPSLPVLMFSVHGEDQYAVRALKTGAAGYLTKNCEPELLIAALRKVAQGGRYVSPSLAERLAEEVTAKADRPPHAALTNREYQVLWMLAEGKTVKQVATTLSLSIKTVSTYRTRILKKMHLKTTAELIRYAISTQLDKSQPVKPTLATLS